MYATDIAQRLGLRRYPRSWRGRCPACDYPGTFSVRAARDGRALLFCVSCEDRDALADAVARATGQERQPEPRDDRDDSKARRQWKQETALRLWRGSVPATGTPADVYLTARGLPGLAASPALRFRADCSHPEGGRYPAMVALVTDVVGAPIAVHRTYLTRDGRKAGVEPAKASLGPIWGGAIRLGALTNDKPLVIGEGIESSASAGRVMSFPAWAAICAGNLGTGLVLPPEVHRVVIATDPDKAGRAAAREAWTRWRAEGRMVQVAAPLGEGDFNDILLMQEVVHV
jgi:putative DNA primase/helicase